MSLIVKNLGGARKGVEDMGVLGNPAKYAMVLGENEEASPWVPHHVQQGFASDQSCFTVSFPNSYAQIVPRGTDDCGILETIKERLGPQWRQLTLLVCPSHAETLADAGWTTQSIVDELERTRPAPPATGTGRFSAPEGVRILVAGGPGGGAGQGPAAGE